MKKLMIAAAIVCAAALSQAATANWTYESSTIYAAYNATQLDKMYISSKVTSGTAYLVYFGGGEATGLTQAQLLAGLRGDKTMADYSDYILKTAPIGSDGKVATTAKFDVDTTKMYSKGSGEDKIDYLQAYTVVVVDDYVFLSATKEAPYDSNNEIGAMVPASTNSSYLRDNDGTKAWDSTKAGWYSTVPEPTSGLLLLLGVAGLALRRRRA